jgi:ATP-dependent helicase HrpA
MREWQDLYAQLHDALDELGTLRLNESNAAYDAIHRSILTGLLGHVATRLERNLYQASGNRKVNIFPGSALHARGEPQKKAAPARGKAPPKPPSTHQPLWVIAGEIVETSQLFARTIAGIDPLWIVQLAPHLCKVTYRNPHWSVTSGRVLAEETATLYGLEVRKRKVAYGNIDTKAATHIFIRSALVEENLLPLPHSREGASSEPDFEPETDAPDLPPAYKFLEHNRQIRQRIMRPSL